MEVVNRYVTDEEARAHFAAAHAVVLPYHRSSSSGPLHMAMSAGLPVAVTAVGGLVDAAGDYAGALLVPARDPQALAEALVELADRRGQRYDDPHSWDRTTDAYLDLVATLTGTPSPSTAPSENTAVPVRSAS
ncbi:glycosyltransferase [Lapillicoccus jejuensis]|uniref:glycosyltransferase n=1 Tax=Lapillicoccus jejuensis TaxID=402171 RepID=UPI001FEBF9B2|nr:glycosyltransferase [Lapillicoccus jejuensis]